VHLTTEKQVCITYSRADFIQGAEITNVYKMSTCLLANIGATRHDLCSISVSFGWSVRESWSFLVLSSLSSLSSHFLRFLTRSTVNTKIQKMQSNIVPAMEGWRPTRQTDNQTFI
jgi:hypothetical protein